MRNHASAVLLLALLGCLSPPIPRELVEATPPPVPEPMKLNEVIRLSEAGLSDEVIVGLVRTRGVGERLSLSEVLVLGHRGVSTAVQLALVTAPPAGPARTPAPRIVYRELYIPLWPVYGGGRWRLGCRIGILHGTEEPPPAPSKKPQPPVPQPESIDP